MTFFNIKLVKIYKVWLKTNSKCGLKRKWRSAFLRVELLFYFEDVYVLSWAANSAKEHAERGNLLLRSVDSQSQISVTVPPAPHSPPSIPASPRRAVRLPKSALKWISSVSLSVSSPCSSCWSESDQNTPYIWGGRSNEQWRSQLLARCLGAWAISQSGRLHFCVEWPLKWNSWKMSWCGSRPTWKTSITNGDQEMLELPS